ncbi:MAG: GGDEF domain-containing protein [Clostridia bacterium]|nr:GGDEF domain-containing protein [Clostridia bacterium]
MPEVQNQKKLSIGLILDRLEETYQALFWPGVADFAKRNNIQLKIFVGTSLGRITNYSNNYDMLENIISENNVDGLIIMTGVMGFYYTKKDIVKFCDQFRPLPIVSVALELDGFTNILSDNKAGIREIMTHLIEVHSCRKLAFICGPTGHDEAEERFRAYKDMLAYYHIPFNENLIAPGCFTIQSGIDGVKLIIDERKELPDAVLCVDDETAIGALKALKALGLRVPQDIFLTGFDDTEDAFITIPPLTTVKQQFYEQGQTAIDYLTKIIRNQYSQENIYLPTRLVIRESCGCFSNFLDNPGNSTDALSLKQDSLSFEEFRRKTVAIIVHEFISSSVDRITVTHWLNELISSLFTYFEDETQEDTFINQYNDILMRSIEYGDLSAWNNVLASIRSNVLAYFSSKYNRFQIEYIFQKCRNLLDNLSMRYHTPNREMIRQKTWTLREVIQSLVATFNQKTLLDVLEKSLTKLNVPTCFVVLYDTIVLKQDLPSKKLPNTSKLIFAYSQNTRIDLNQTEIVFPTQELLPKFFMEKYSSSLTIFMPLFFDEEHLGFILFEPGDADNMIYENLRFHISSGIKGALLFQETKQTESELVITLQKLAALNDELKTLSIRDELTGLYNRRGFFENAQKHYHAANNERSEFILFFVDLDHLKMINDTFGHSEGDFAIFQTAQILKDTFQKTDILARIGGDEFTVLVRNLGNQYLDNLIGRLKENIEKCNLSLQKPYTLSLSFGVQVYDPNSGFTFEEVVHHADKKLYEEKRQKKSG